MVEKMYTELKAINDSRKSFYGKANVSNDYGDEETLTLISYSTKVASIKGNMAIVNGYYSPTTARHINEFLQQNGFKKLNKKEMESGKPLIK